MNELNRGTSEMISTRRSRKKVKYTYDEEELEDSFDEEEESDYDEGQAYNVEDDMEDEDFDEVIDDDNDEYDEWSIMTILEAFS